MKFILVETVDQVLVAALLSPGEYDGSGNGAVQTSTPTTAPKLTSRRRKQSDTKQSDTQPPMTM
jgi:hypothetical protein